MKTLYLVRHAKSSWSNPVMRDFDRPLNKRGIRDAPLMAEFFFKNEKLDVIKTSPARRALETAKRFSLYNAQNPVPIAQTPDIYEASVTTLFKVIQSIGEEYQNVALVGHNPALTELTNYITGSTLDNIPTCGIVKIDLNIATWREAAMNKGVLVFFEFPKKLF